MATRHNLISLLILVLLPVLPAQAQEAALDNPQSSITAAARPAQMPQPSAGVPVNNCNLRHWSRFTQSTSSSPFRCVPAGTKVSGPQANVSHYIRPQCVNPGSVPAAQQHKTTAKTTITYSAGAKKTAAAQKQARNQTIALGYGRRIGEVTYTPVSSRWSGTRISCYGRYH